ncbi:MAG: T9SS type A sorting domain-containing protein, partial [Candidatus Paceibacterota bacterium]
YVLYNTTNNIYKKIYIPELTFDTLWNIVISNIDNSDSNFVQINKNDYPNKMFAYYNATTNQLEDREPAKNTWDLLWTKYTTFVFSPMGSGLYPLSGVFSNPAVSVAKNIGKKCDQVWLANKTATDNPKISLIGGDWKTFSMGSYTITDTFVYFITANSKTYKLTFKGFVGGAQGKSLFNVYEATLSNKEIVSQNQTNVYPNPTNGEIFVQSDANLLSYELFDLKGVKLLSGDLNNEAINISDFQNGVYILSITTESGKFHSKLIKN